ncbi:MAG: copper ion binding protein [Zymomonas mobilis subsp. pomaceae]|uniref:Copper ion binding protein n=1 Tax=Zymomonas mobilis subsp. pomaceae (strain ATCC 29192 / DSM 22645 / JCM 10191 / CCUG 17912 / NBRC 13757 / NCIMB 11200 / NRRL B-4491 / Barker I) TaxID=579138 RepID=F8EUW7_ZYMMT|nr:copper ion binding protein [Zymomonas mobilis]AEI37255.1 copper ion binding protein [Zymomonas mobilis subsp. pomaceae ATCC 29192]MDX5948624.1 copper ion binding protein [Zymomonas mobilis subsp. pomaceae]GEB88430.1 copper chaperone CopZ [Zymomonas mobilis subsp. pomaceae]
MTRLIIQVDGMHCEHCVKAIENGLGQLDGITEVKVSLKNKAVTVDYSAEKITEEAIRKEIEDLGYEVQG